MADLLTGSVASDTLGKSVKRRGELELARITACCCIIIIHLNFVYNVHYPAGSFLRILSKGCATTIFFMITGAFLKAGQPFATQVRRLAVKNIIPFLVVTPLILQFWPAMAGYAPLTTCFQQWNVTFGGFTAMLFAMNVDAIVSSHGYPVPNGGIYHLWFMFALYKCYFFLPILKVFLVDGPATAAAKRYALATGGIAFLLVPTVKLFAATGGVFAKLPEIQLEPFLWLWVMLVGNHLYYHLRARAGQLRRGTGLFCILLYLAAGCFLYFLTMRYALETDQIHANDRFMERGFIPLFAANTALFVFFTILRIPNEKLEERIRLLANKVFYIYLFHVPVLAIVRTHLFPNLSPYSAAGKLMAATIVFTICYGLARLCRGVEQGVAGLAFRSATGNLSELFFFAPWARRSLRRLIRK